MNCLQANKMPDLLRLSIAAIGLLALAACGDPQQPAETEPDPAEQAAAETEPDPEPDLSRNPLVADSLTAYSTPPFHRIEPGHFLPALEWAIDNSREALDDLVENDQPADFDNTLRARADAESDLVRISAAFHGLSQVFSGAEWRDAATEFSARLAEHASEIRSHPALFERIRAVDSNAGEELDAEQARLVEHSLALMRRSGAGLDDPARDQLKSIDGQLAELSARFNHNLRRETQRFEMHIEDQALVDALPEAVAIRAARDALDRGFDGGWVFTLNAHSLFEFLRHSPDRERRKELYQAWQRRAGGMRYGQERDNPEIMARMASLRAERAALLGHEHHLDLVLEDATVGDVERIESLLDTIEAAARERAGDELEAIRQAMAADGVDESPRPWDWWYYREQLSESERQAPDADMRQYFGLEQVREGAFALANRLWGLTFRERTDLPIWDPQVKGYEVRDADGTELGLIYLDYPHRQGKAGGAWMSTYVHQHYADGERVPPVVANVANFPPTAGGEPMLLSPDETETLFHEFGHAIHALLSDVEFRALSGTAVPADFVEFPGLLFERWALQPEMLRLYAFHHQTGSIIDDESIDALQRRGRFMAALQTLEQIAATRIDLAWHRVRDDESPDLRALEARVREDMELPELLSPGHRFDGYRELFAGNRAGSDYRMLWAEVLAADAFAAFRDNQLMDRNQADRLREEILSRGNSRPPMASWEAFRERDPEVDHLLRERGLD